MNGNRKNAGKASITLVLGLSGLLLVACSNADDQSNTVAKTNPAVSAAGQVSVAAQASEQTKPKVVMYKSPTCECCGGWAEHLRKAGFTVVEHKRDDMDAVKSKYGVSEKLASCHTAIVDGYVIEGHVPAADIERLLQERPAIVGLTAPGMPMKSPGMQSSEQTPKNYDVLAFDKDGTSRVFTHY